MKPKKSLSKILTLLAAVFILSLNVFSRVSGNGAGTGYVSNTNGNTGGIQEIGVSTEKTIEMYIAEGSGYYLGVVSSVNNLFQIYEGQDINGIDFYRLNRLVDQALLNMNKAITTYETLIQQAETTPYNKEVQEKLAGFDYYAFMMEKRLNKVIFQEVEGYLKPGCITGVFKHTLENFLIIKALLESIKSEAAVNRVPKIDNIWLLNEHCMETSCFGSYVARVFYGINN